MLANYPENDYGKNACLLQVNIGARKRVVRGREAECRNYYILDTIRSSFSNTDVADLAAFHKPLNF
jgi:hypothetical protein